MKKRIIEIVEFGIGKSIIQRENEPTSELIDTQLLLNEVNYVLRDLCQTNSTEPPRPHNPTAIKIIREHPQLTDEMKDHLIEAHYKSCEVNVSCEGYTPVSLEGVIYGSIDWEFCVFASDIYSASTENTIDLSPADLQTLFDKTKNG